MAEIDLIKQKLNGTHELELIENTDSCYDRCSEEQKQWYEKSKFYCIQGCGSCCHNFEPDLTEGEALFMACWLLENQHETALRIAENNFPFENGKTCPFYDSENPYHCSIYGGRPFICRLFGASCSHGKDGKKVWKPCKFYPETELKKYSPLLSHRQFTAEEARNIFGSLPPAMSDIMEQAVLMNEKNETKLIREILPQTVQKLLWILQMNNN